MEESVRNTPEARPVNALVVYDPRSARRARLGRAARAARAALAIWGAVSLAGIGGAAVLHGTGGLDALARPGEAMVVAAADAEGEQPAAQAATPEPIPLPGPPNTPLAPAPLSAAPIDAVVAMPGPLHLPREPSPEHQGAVASLPKPAAVEPDAAPAEPAASVALARLPRSRPRNLIVADSVARRDPAQIRWRIRKLHEMPLRYAYTPHHAYAPSPPPRIPPPLLYQR